MGTTKSQIFTKQQNHLAKIAKVLGHPARIAILERITESNSCICNSLVNEIGLAQSTISQHLKELKSVGIINGTIEGKKTCYCANTSKLKEIQSSINNFFNHLQSKDCCC